MTERYAAVLALPAPSHAAPPGADPEELRLALLEDTYEVAADMGRVTAVLALCGDQPVAEEVTWPGTPLLRLGVPSDDPDGGGSGEHTATTARAHDSPALIAATLTGLGDLGAQEGAVLACDAPDLPIMLLGKLFQGLEFADVSACPAEGGGLVGLAARLPAVEWLRTARVGLDTADALARLRAAAPDRRSLSVVPGWRRLRSPADIAKLDPGLEGWETTRALLAGRKLS